MGDFLTYTIESFHSKRSKLAFKIKKGERFYPSYLLELKGNSLVAVLAKELVSGRLDFIVVAQFEDEERVLLRVKDLEKEHYNEVVSGLIQTLHSEGLLVDVRAVCPKHFEKLVECLEIKSTTQ